MAFVSNFFAFSLKIYLAAVIGQKPKGVPAVLVKNRGLYLINWYKPRNNTNPVVIPTKQYLLCNICRSIQADVIKVHLARAAGYCHIAFGPQANSYPVDVGQVDALIGKSL